MFKIFRRWAGLFWEEKLREKRRNMLVKIIRKGICRKCCSYCDFSSFDVSCSILTSGQQLHLHVLPLVFFPLCFFESKYRLYWFEKHNLRRYGINKKWLTLWQFQMKMRKILRERLTTFTTPFNSSWYSITNISSFFFFRMRFLCWWFRLNILYKVLCNSQIRAWT